MAEKNSAAKDKRKRASTKKTVKRAATKNNPNTVTSNRLKLLVTVVGRNKADYYTDVLQEFEVNMQMVAFAQGTANAKMLSYLGLTDTEKAVIFSVIQETKLPAALASLSEKFESIKDGKGIAFTVPLTSVIGTLIFGFLSNNKTVVKENKQ